MTTSLQSKELDQLVEIDPHAIDEFRRAGCVHLNGILSAELLTDFEPEFSRQVQNAQPDLPPLAERGTYGRAFVQVCNLWLKSAPIERFVKSRRLAAIASTLLGCRGVRLYHDQALYKEPGGGHTPWHCDQQYWPLDNPRSVTAWIPLQETPCDMGPVAFAPGSHRYTEGRGLPISDESEEILGSALMRLGYPCVEQSFALGDVSFHTGWTYHRAGQNRTQSPRRVMTIIYMDSDTRVGKPETQSQEYDRQSFFPGLAIGDLAATPLTPILYHRDQ